MNELLTGLNGGNVPALDAIFTLTMVALLPSLVVMMTSFTRIIIILALTRNAMGVQQTPPNMVLTGIALFLTLYIMNPVLGQLQENAYEPYVRGEITQQEAVTRLREKHAGSVCQAVGKRGGGECGRLPSDCRDSCLYD